MSFCACWMHFVCILRAFGVHCGGSYDAFCVHFGCVGAHVGCIFGARLVYFWYMLGAFLKLF